MAPTAIQTPEKDRGAAGRLYLDKAKVQASGLHLGFYPFFFTNSSMKPTRVLTLSTVTAL
jgi:hypothetical protein